VRATFLASTAAVAASALCAGVLTAAPAGAGSASPTASGPSSQPPAAARAAAAITLGQTGGVPGVCTATPTVPAATLLAAEGAGAPTYVAPTNGVLVSFSHKAGTSVSQVRAIVFANSSPETHKVVAAKSTLQTLRTNVVNTFPVRLPILAGQRLGLGFTTKQTVCLVEGVPGDTSTFASAFNPDTTNDYYTSGTFTGGSYRPNISAVLEPDVDGDAYGDITQDACPESALSQVVCPAPDTVLTTKLKKHRGTSRIKLKFVSTIAGSTFQCARDGHKFKPCASPYKRHFGPGKHKLLIRAVSAAGIADASPIKVKFRIRKR